MQRLNLRAELIQRRLHRGQLRHERLALFPGLLSIFLGSFTVGFLSTSQSHQRWRSLLDAHDRTVREQLRRFRGREIDTTGDGFVISFDGPAMHISARVGARAAPGEVLVSGTVKDLVVGSAIEFADRGEHELKGVPGPGNSSLWRTDAPRSMCRYRVVWVSHTAGRACHIGLPRDLV